MFYPLVKKKKPQTNPKQKEHRNYYVFYIFEKDDAGTKKISMK